MFSSQPQITDDEELAPFILCSLTRAEQHLNFLCRFKNDGKELEPSMFIAEIQDQHAITSGKSVYR